MSRLRVGFWVPTFSCAGGTETWHRTLLKGLDRDQIDIRGISIDDDSGFEVSSDLLDLGCNFICANTSVTGNELLLGDCDVIVTWGILDHAQVGRMEDRPTMIMVAHGDGHFPEFVQANHEASPWVDHYVAVSEAALEAIPEDRHGDTTIIRNGIDTDRLVPRVTRSEQRAAWGIPESSRVLGMVCRASREKDPRALIRAIHHLPDYWCGVLIGDGPELLDCVSSGFSQGTRCFFPGAQDDVGSAYQAMDCLLSASLSEGFGYVALEALVFGLPVVATAVGALKNAERSTQCPVTFVPSHAPSQVLAEAVEQAMRRVSTKQGQRDRDLASLSIQTNYSAETFCRTWTDYLLRLPCKTRASQSTSP